VLAISVGVAYSCLNTKAFSSRPSLPRDISRSSACHLKVTLHLRREGVCERKVFSLSLACVFQVLLFTEVSPRLSRIHGENLVTVGNTISEISFGDRQM
jgi:hypothetical protein